MSMTEFANNLFNLNTIKKIFFPLFFPLSKLWETVYRVRRFAYQYGLFTQHNFDVPILSVGNLTFGGTGKTPTTLWLAKQFEASGKKVMILSRGYKGEFENSYGVLDASKRLSFNPHRYGDEAVVMARKLESSVIVVGKHRSKNLDYFYDLYRPDIVLLDDGHQHLKLNRDLDIVLFDAMLPLEQYFTAPLGYMREGFHGLRKADIILLARADQVSKEKLQKLNELMARYISSDACVAEIGYRPEGLFDANYKKILNVEEIKGKKVINMAAIGSPELFFRMIRSYGAEVLEDVSFADHHNFTIEEVRPYVEKAEREQAYILTTGKDMVKLRQIVDTKNLLFLDIELYFLNGGNEVGEIISQVCDF